MKWSHIAIIGILMIGLVLIVGCTQIQKEECIKEGEHITDPHLTNLITKCCDGLKEIGPYSETQEYLNLSDCSGNAIEGNYGICSNCGDGICKSWENICNCPDDCS